jgi:tRNA pseudouridine55 synthase
VVRHRRRDRGKGRNIHGIVLLDKPRGYTSNAALQWVKRLYRANKAGHTGSLDPLATGLLPICLGEATKISTFLLEADKRYELSCELGVKTATGDAEGKVVAMRTPVGITRERIVEVLRRFTGEIEQVPSMYSAAKYRGQPLYKLAHQGIEVERKVRRVRIYELTLLEQEGNYLGMQLRCSKGTYVRTLIEDIGEVLGCGAHVTALHRTATGPFVESQATTLEELEALAKEDEVALDAKILPIESALVDWPSVILSEDAVYYAQMGQAVIIPHAPTEGWVRLYAADRRFFGVGQVLDDGRIAPRRLIRGG